MYPALFRNFLIVVRIVCTIIIILFIYDNNNIIIINDITGIIHNTFSVEHNAFGEMQVHELKPGGKDVEVTEENKKEYVKLFVQWTFLRGIEAQFLALQKGFNELIPQHLLKPFDERELELVIGGLGKIDIDDWQVS